MIIFRNECGRKPGGGENMKLHPHKDDDLSGQFGYEYSLMEGSGNIHSDESGTIGLVRTICNIIIMVL